MGLIKTLLLASVYQRGFKDGQEGNCPSFEFCEPFPQDSEPAKVYYSAYERGQTTTKIKLTSNVADVIGKIAGK